MPEPSTTTEPSRYTLGQLISDLEGSERAYQENLRTANRVEAKDGHNLQSTWWKMAAAALLFQSDPNQHPGIDRIEALCDEWGTGLNAENVRKLRGRVCNKLGVGVSVANAMTLDTVAEALGLGAGTSKADTGERSSPAEVAEDLPAYTAEEQPWFTTVPPITSVPTAELTALADEVEIVVITATDPELLAVLRRLEPYPGRGEILKGFVDQETYYLGKFGSCPAAVTKCRMGSLDSGGATLATQHAQQVWRPMAVIMVGIALGKGPKKQKMADVLIASQIISYEPQRVEADQIVSRGPIPSTNTTLLNRFEHAWDWSFCRPDGSKCERHVGPLLSGEKLVDDPVFKADLLRRYPQAIGGEMEGVGLAAAAIRQGVPWILVKAICDWADGKKNSKHQPLAAAAAVSLVHHVLSQPGVLHGLAQSVDPRGETKRMRDLATIQELFAVFPGKTVDFVLMQAAVDRIHTDHIDCLIDAGDIFYSNRFHLYDAELRQLLEDFFKHWNLAWDVGRGTHHDHLHRGLATLTLTDTDPSERWEEHEKYLEHVAQAQRALASINKRIHENYLDFDLRASDEEATRKYQEMREQVRREAEGRWGTFKSNPPVEDAPKEDEGAVGVDQTGGEEGKDKDVPEESTSIEQSAQNPEPPASDSPGQAAKS